MGRKIRIAAAAALLLASAGLGGTALYDEPKGVTLEADVVMSSDPAAAPAAFYVRENPDPFGDPADALRSVRSWQVQVLDQAGRKVSFLQGKGRPPAGGLTWHGVSSSGEPLPDGFYKARFAWLGLDGRPRSSPAVMVSLSTPLELRRLAAARLRLEYTAEGLAVTFQESRIFDPGQSAIKGEALPALGQVSEFLRGARGNRVIVRGHSDSTGSARRNLALSAERAARVCRFLEESGVEAGRLSYAGLGPSRPAAGNATEEGRARNRRVEIVVLKRGGGEESLAVI